MTLGQFLEKMSVQTVTLKAHVQPDKEQPGPDLYLCTDAHDISSWQECMTFERCIVYKCGSRECKQQDSGSKEASEPNAMATAAATATTAALVVLLLEWILIFLVKEDVTWLSFFTSPQMLSINTIEV